MARQPWPHTPDEDDPPIGVSIRPIGPDRLPPLPPPPEPILPVLPAPTSRRTQVFGNPGASAMAQYRRRRAAELADYLRTLPLRLAAVAAAALVAGLLTLSFGLPPPQLSESAAASHTSSASASPPEPRHGAAAPRASA